MTKTTEQILALAKKTGLYDYQPQVSVMKDFAKAAIESYKAELLKEVGEPVAYARFNEAGELIGLFEQDSPKKDRGKLYTSDQVAAAILKAEQRVAEACAKVCDTKLGHEIFKIQSECARQIRSGEYRKFMKEV